MNKPRMQENTIAIDDYDSADPRHRQAFAGLNREWLERYFAVEDRDAAAFADPEGTVLDKGGVILMARQGDAIVGTGSLVAMEEEVYEIAKMAVTEAFQAQGIGRRILAALLARAKIMGARKLFIVSNTRLEHALGLYRRHGFVDSAENRHSHYARGNITLERTV